MTTTVSPALRRRFSQQAQQPALADGVQPGQRLVEDQHARRAGQQTGQHEPPHLPAAELVDAPQPHRGVEADGSPAPATVREWS